MFAYSGEGKSFLDSHKWGEIGSEFGVERDDVETGASRTDNALRAAQLYHLDGLTQAAVAERLGCTRWTVGRLLTEAQEQGLLRIEIHHPKARRPDLEQRLINVFGLADARVVRTQESTTASTALVLTETANYLRDLRPAPRVAAFGWGRTIAGLAWAMPKSWTEHIIAVQAVAAPAQLAQLLGEDAVATLAEKGGGVAYSADAPTIASDARTAEALLARPDVKETLEYAAAAELCVFAPGPARDCTLFVRYGQLSEKELCAVVEMGATCNVLGRFIDNEGNEVSSDLKHRTVGMSLDQARQVRSLVAVGAGQAKADPLRSAATSGLATIIITDSEAAEAILAVS